MPSSRRPWASTRRAPCCASRPRATPTPSSTAASSGRASTPPASSLSFAGPLSCYWLSHRRKGKQWLRIWISELIKKTAQSYGKDTAFLRAASHPSKSCEEGEVVACIKAEMEKLGFDEVSRRPRQRHGLHGRRRQDHRHRLSHRHRRHRQPRQLGLRDHEGFRGRPAHRQPAAAPTRRAAWPPTYAADDEGHEPHPRGLPGHGRGTVQEGLHGMCWQYIWHVDGIKPASSSSPPSPPTAVSTVVTAAAWRFRVDVHGTSCHGSAPSAAITPSTDGRHHRQTSANWNNNG